MKPDHDQLAALFPHVATQLKQSLTTLNIAASLMIPKSARAQDAKLDADAAVMDQSYYRLLRMVNSLADAEYLVSETPLPVVNIDFVDLVTDVFAKAEAQAHFLDLNMRLVCPRDYLYYAGNRAALEKLLFHLLSNAMKFTPAGGTITLELQAKDKQILMSVADTGPGIASEVLPLLFERYLHQDILLPPPHGLGLGLPICRSVAQRLGGTLLADSTPGKGSRFVCALPMRQAPLRVSDVPATEYGGFNATLLALADALPAAAFRLYNQDE